MITKTNNLVTNLIFTTAILLFAVGTYFFFSKQEELFLIPNSRNFKINSYNDSELGGNSGDYLAVNLDSTSYSLSYSLGNQLRYSFVGLVLELANDRVIDLSDYTTVEITVKALKGQIIPFYIKGQHLGYSTVGEVNTYVPFKYEMPVSTNMTTLTMELEEFSIPKWWLDRNNVKKRIEFSEVSKNVLSFNFENCTLIDDGVQDLLTIEKIMFFKKDKKSPILFLAGALFLLLGFAARKRASKA
ncbi:MAG: hypothetical protein ACJAZ2_000154 [Glaciecola sp.]|jgi:hypothetical protein